MASIAAKSTADQSRSAERVLLGAIRRYDISRLLVAASASRFEVISEEEKSEIIKNAQSDQRKMRKDFEALILEKDRLKHLASFILHFNRQVQDAALEVVSPVKRRTQPPANKYEFGCSHDFSDSQESSFSSGNSKTPPSPMDVDTKVSALQINTVVYI